MTSVVQRAPSVDREWAEPAQPDDDREFLAVVHRLVGGLVAAHALDVRLVHIDNWFGPKWLGFTGKVLGAVGVRRDTTRTDLGVPPFSPGRVVWDRLVSEHGYVRREPARALHLEQVSSKNQFRFLRQYGARAHFVWFSGGTARNGRGSVLVASLHDEAQDAYYLGFAQRAGQWHLGDVAGYPPMDPADLLVCDALLRPPVVESEHDPMRDVKLDGVVAVELLE